MPSFWASAGFSTTVDAPVSTSMDSGHAVGLRLDDEVAVGAFADAHGLLAVHLRVAAQDGARRQQLADHAMAEGEDLVAIAVAGDQQEGDRRPGDKVTRRLAQAPAIAAGDRRGEEDQHGQAGNADGEVGRVEACDGARVGTQQQRQSRRSSAE